MIFADAMHVRWLPIFWPATTFRNKSRPTFAADVLEVDQTLRSWHADNSIAQVGRGFSQASVSKILMPRQSYLDEIDKDNSRDVDAVQREI
jgi:hypothetical protein